MKKRIQGPWVELKINLRNISLEDLLTPRKPENESSPFQLGIMT